MRRRSACSLTMTARVALLAALLAGGAAALPGGGRAALAQDQAARPDVWSDVAEFSYVQTAGNSETSTLGFKDTLTGKRDSSMFELKAAAVRARSTTFTRFATGTLLDPDEHTDRDSALTAENYVLGGRYDRKISARFFWFAGAGWDRNTFAGIQNRYSAGGGLGNIWRDDDRIKFRTDYAATITKQEDVVDNPDVDDTFAGVRFSWRYVHKFGASTTYGNDFTVDENFKETSDWRGDMTNWVAVAMNKRLALKVSLQWLYDNQPAFEEVTVYDVYPPAPPATVLGTTLVELDELDTIFQTSLVVNF